LSRNKVAVPEGAAGIPPFWSVRTVPAAHVHDRLQKSYRTEVDRTPSVHVSGIFWRWAGARSRKFWRRRSSLTYWDRKDREEDRGSPVLASALTGRRQSAAEQKGQRTEESK